ncbi:hypothetical protein HYU06_07375 [Candidatus Woesearchaeota archaeon]|nr:hypothetical protein [Candidatus Woesearchaeota archaeon]
MPSAPYIITGQITNGSTKLASRKVAIANNTTEDSDSVYTDSNGNYSYDLANLTKGYSNGDSITISVDAEATTSFSVEVREHETGIMWRRRLTRATYPYLDAPDIYANGRLDVAIVEASTNGNYKLRIIYEG